MKNQFKKFPVAGTEAGEVLNFMETRRKKDFGWEEGKMFGYVYHPGDELAETLESAHNMFLHDSRLNPTAFNSLRQMENEMVSMVGNLMHGGSKVCGSLTSGGTESILMAMKVAREIKREQVPGVAVEVIAPLTIHPAFDKAAQYLDIKLVKTPLRDDFRADVEEMAKAINKNTAMLVGSAPCFPYGLVDPIEEISDLARKNGLLCHVDACLGGFMLPFLEGLGHRVPPFDFRVKGVTSISADSHKYGYSAKGASIILYRNPELRKHQFFVTTDWPGGIFATSTLQGSRGGGPLASAWAMVNNLGYEGYSKLAARAMKAAKKIQEWIEKIDGIELVSNPEMSVFALRSCVYNIYNIGDELSKRGWLIDCLQNPAAIHISISQNHIGIEADFIRDLKKVISGLRPENTQGEAKQAPVKLISKLSELIPERKFSWISSFASRFMKNQKGGQGGATLMYGITANLKNRNNLKEMILSIYDRMYR